MSGAPNVLEELLKARAKREKGAAYVPRKYTSGLSAADAAKRKREIERRSREGGSYEQLHGDEDAKTRPSKYSRTELAKRTREELESPSTTSFIQTVAKLTGIAPRILRKVHRRGAEAWAVGHRAGASQVAWARARVYSFATGGKTQKTADADLWREHLEDKK